MRGFTRASLFRMRQFHDIYRLDKKVSPLVRQLPWSHNLLILRRSKHLEEREFYLRLCLREQWSKRELERQLAGALFERTVLSPPKVSALPTQIHPAAETMQLYLEALDRDVKKPHERPSIGVLLCATKDHEVVE